MADDHQLGDAPIEKRYIEEMQQIAHGLDELFNGSARGGARKTGFVLMVFPFGDLKDGRCNYISNGADREDIVLLMREMIAKFEGQASLEGHA